MQRIKVDLPEPEGPMTTTTSPFRMVVWMPLRTSRSPKFFFSPLISNRTLSAVTALHPPLKKIQPLPQHDVQGQVDDRGNIVARQRVVGGGDDDAVVVHQVADAEILDDGRLLDHGHKLIAQRQLFFRDVPLEAQDTSYLADSASTFSFSSTFSSIIVTGIIGQK